MTQKKANDPAALRCDNEPCLFHHLGICRFSCHKWEPCANTGAQARIDHMEELDMKLVYRKGYCDGSLTNATGRNPDGTYDFNTVTDWIHRANAAEARIDAVVKELEARKITADMEYKSAQAYGFRVERKGMASAYKVAIALLKEGLGNGRSYL